MVVSSITRLAILQVAVQIFAGCSMSVEAVEHDGSRAGLSDAAIQKRTNSTESEPGFWAAYGDPLPLIGSSKVSHASAVEFQFGIVAERIDLPALRVPSASRAAGIAALEHADFLTQSPLRI